MSEYESEPEVGITSNDRLWAALSWIPILPLWPILPVLALLLKDTKDRPYIRYHAIHSLATGVVLIPITILTLGLGAVLFLALFYWAYQAYEGQWVEVPVVTKWVKNQGWV